MGTRFSSNCLPGAASLALLFGSVAPQTLHGATYLAAVGPTPLRFQSLQNIPPLNLPELAMADPAAPAVTGTWTNITGAPEVLTAKSPDPAPQQYNFGYMPFGVPWMPPAPGGPGYDSMPPRPPEPSPVMPMGSEKPPGPGPGAGILAREANPAPEPPSAAPLMVVTPQMLVDYFRPSKTNSPASNGSVGFTAPTSAPPTGPSNPGSRTP